MASNATVREKVTQVIDNHFAFCREDADRARFVYALFFVGLERRY